MFRLTAIVIFAFVTAVPAQAHPLHRFMNLTASSRKPLLHAVRA